MVGLLQDRVAVVTGGARGIGRAVAIRFAREGAKVVVADILDTLGHETIELIQQQVDGQNRALFVHTDVESVESIRECMRLANDFGGNNGIQVLVNNAVKFTFGHLSGAGSGSGTATDRDITSEDWLKIFNINVLGYARCIEQVVPYMKNNELSNVVYNNDQGEGVNVINAGSRGSIVNISSVSGFIAQPEFVPYNSTKGAVEQLSKCCAMDLGKFNIRVNTLAPGTVETPGSYNHMRTINLSLDEGRKQFAQLNLFKRQAAPEEIANGALFLASDQSSFVTGTRLVMDGGETID